MSTTNEGLSSDVTTHLLEIATRSRGTGLAMSALVLSVSAVLLSGFGLYLQIDQRKATASQHAWEMTQAIPSPAPVSPAPVSPAALPVAPVQHGEVSRDEDVRIAQSEDGAIYAYDPNTKMAFRFAAGAGSPTSIDATAIPADVRDRILTGQGAQQATIDDGAVEQRAVEASDFIAAQHSVEDRRRPPINALLNDPQITGTILSSLKQAQTILRPDREGNVDAKIYAFFDPQCPYCHRAFSGLDGVMPVEWVPVSALGPAGDKLQVYIQGEASIGSREVGGQNVPAGVWADDDERGDRLREVMVGNHRPSDAELTDAMKLVLQENSDLFVALSKGAESLRAVPSFFAVRPDGTGVWLQGYDEDTTQLLADITAGQDDRS